MRNKLMCITLIALCLYSCGDNVTKEEYSKVIAENKSLQNKIISLENEIEEYKYSPEKLLAEANEFYKSEDVNGLNLMISKIKKYHPQSKEVDIIEELGLKLTRDIEDKLKKEEERKLLSLSKLKKNFDDISGTTWYKQPYFTHYTNTNLVSLYMGDREDGSPWLRLMMSYTGDDWIFFEKAYLSYDGNTHEVLFDRYGDKKTDNDGGYVWEWIDVYVDLPLLLFLRDFKDGKELKMRLSGKYTKTRNLSSNEKKGIQDLILAYDVLSDNK